MPLPVLIGDGLDPLLVTTKLAHPPSDLALNQTAAFRGGTVAVWQVPHNLGWVELRDALVHYQYSARLDLKRTRGLRQNLGDFVKAYGLDRTTFLNARSGHANWGTRFIAVATEIGPDALPNPGVLHDLIASARVSFENARKGLAQPTHVTKVPWPPRRSSYAAGQGNLRPIAFELGRGGGRPGDRQAANAPQPILIRVGPPEREWSEQDIRDRQYVVASLRVALTQHVLEAQDSQAVPLPDAAPTPTVAFDFDSVGMRRVQGDEWRGAPSDLTVEVWDDVVIVSGFIHHTWPFAILESSYSVMDGHFVVEAAEWEPEVGRSSRQRRPIRVRALRRYRHADPDEGHLLVTRPAHVFWDRAGDPHLSWDAEPAELTDWSPL